MLRPVVELSNRIINLINKYLLINYKDFIVERESTYLPLIIGAEYQIDFLNYYKNLTYQVIRIEEKSIIGYIEINYLNCSRSTFRIKRLIKLDKEHFLNQLKEI